MAISAIPGSTVQVPEIPFLEQVRLQAGDSALIIVDMVNDFVKPEGSLLVPSAAGTIGNIKKLLDAARESGAHVAFTQDTSMEDDPEFEIWPKHCIRGTWGWQIIDDLAPRQPEELVVVKYRYDGFYESTLDHVLARVWGVKNLVIVGTVSNVCVLHTVASAALRWYNVIVPADGISAITEFDQALTLRQVSALYNGGVVRSVDDIEFVKGED